MAFIFLSADALDQRFISNAQAAQGGPSSAGPIVSSSVRRPYRGIQIKDDTYATLSVIDGHGSPIPLVSSSYAGADAPADRVGKVEQYADFIIQNIQEERVEKQQILETFGDSFIFFFGERPRMVTITGMLVNTEDFNWRSQFWFNYENFLRGSKLVQKNARVFLSYDSIVIEGYPIQASASENSESPYMIPFQMVMFLTNYHDFSRIGIIDFPRPVEVGVSVDALNRELEDEDKNYVPTGRLVRMAAYEAGLANGATLGSAIRSGLQAVNDVVSAIGGALDAVTTLLSGRVVTVSPGVGGFIASVGLGGGATADALLNELGQNNQFTKVKVIRKAKYTAMSPYALTRISMNWDEYPLRNLKDGTGLSLIDDVFGVSARARQTERALAQQQTELMIAALDQAAGGTEAVLTTITDVIRYAKYGFAVINTIDAAVESPGPVIASTLGVAI